MRSNRAGNKGVGVGTGKNMPFYPPDLALDAIDLSPRMHVRSTSPALGAMMDLANPIVVRAMGVNINRHTVENVRGSSLELEDVEDLGPGGIYKLIRARRSEEHSGRER